MAERHPFVDHFYSAEVRFEAGASARRLVDEWVLGMTISGTTTYHTKAGPITFGPGELYLVHPKVDMQWAIPAAVKGWHCVYAVFSPRAHWHAWLEFPQETPGFSKLKPAKKIARLVRQELLGMNRLFWSSGQQRVDLARNRLERALLHLWGSCSPAMSSADSRITDAIAFFHTTLAASPRLGELARRFGMSRSAFAAAFKRQTGATPAAYHERVRIERATQMLIMTSDPVKAVAARVGFADSKYFSKRFQRISGKSPRAYRQSHRNDMNGIRTASQSPRRSAAPNRADD